MPTAIKIAKTIGRIRNALLILPMAASPIMKFINLRPLRRPVFGRRLAGAKFRTVKFTLLFWSGNLNTDFIIKITLICVYKIMCLSELCEYFGGWLAGARRPVPADCGCPACYHGAVAGGAGCAGVGELMRR